MKTVERIGHLKTRFLPEGHLLYTSENQKACSSRRTFLQAMDTGRILEGRVISCGADRSLVVRAGKFTGMIPREETALGISEGTVREIAILSRVGKPVSFTVQGVEGPEQSPTLLFSRRKAQEAALQHILGLWRRGMIVPATVTHMEPFGAFVDIGCGVTSMIGIENISVSRIPHPGCRFQSGQKIFALVTGVDQSTGRVTLSHKELLGTWEENAAALTAGMTVTGWARGIKEYGIFVEIFPNLSGLSEYREDVSEGDRVSVYVKSISPERRKIKLRILEVLPEEKSPSPIVYFQRDGTLDDWKY